MPTVELHIKGKVQGVFYRASAKEKAIALGLSGWVKNLEDGSVLLRATGGEKELEELEAWCRQGPPDAHVSEIEKKRLPEEGFDRFSIIR